MRTHGYKSLNVVPTQRVCHSSNGMHINAGLIVALVLSSSVLAVAIPSLPITLEPYLSHRSPRENINRHIIVSLVPIPRPTIGFAAEPDCTNVPSQRGGYGSAEERLMNSR